VDLTGKNVVITGGSAGIGLALATTFLAAGSRVLLCGRDPERLQAAREQLATAQVLQADLRTAPDRQLLVRESISRLGAVDILINNAGTQTLMDFTQESAERPVEDEIQINFVAPIRLIEGFLPHLLLRPTAAIVNVTSGLALVPKRSSPVYCATKAGLRSFTQALRYQLAGTSVRVVEALPPLVDTSMTAGRGTGKLSPDAVAHAIVEGLKRERLEIRIGKTRLLFAAHRLSPALAAKLVRDS
jgi:short-subunit dehydrogenase involved in D-alanine esterification of teichoic acids